MSNRPGLFIYYNIIFCQCIVFNNVSEKKQVQHKIKKSNIVYQEKIF